MRLKRLAGCLDCGLAVSHEALEHVGLDARDLQAVEGLLRPSDAPTGAEREARFISLPQAWQASPDPVEPHCATIMSRCEPGLVVGGEAADLPTDHVDLERWCKGPKGHARRLHGQRHAGVRIVGQGPTLRVALAAPRHHEGPWTGKDLEPYGRARVPESQPQAVERGKIMRQARSRKKRPVLLADLEKRYLNAP